MSNANFIDSKDIEQTSLKVLYSVFEVISDSLAVIDTITQKNVYFNSNAHNLLGYTAKEFAQMKINDYDAIETPEIIKQRIDDLLKNGNIHFQTIHKRKDGSIIDVDVRVVAFELGGKPYMLAQYRDISKNVSQAMFLKTLLDSIPDLIWIKDVDGVYLACNPTFERFFGAKEEEIIGKTDYDFASKEVADIFRKNDIYALDNGTNINEEYLIFADGHSGEFETYKIRMIDSFGKIIGVMGIARNITSYKNTIKLIRQQQEDLNQAQKIGKIGSWHFDIAHNELKWSQECYRIFGIEQGTPLSYELFLSKIYPEDVDIVKNAWITSLDGAEYDVEHRIELDGKIKWIRETAKIDFNKDGHAISGIGTAQDITERKEYEARLEKLALYDRLTGLYNREGFLFEIDKLIKSAVKKTQTFALIIFDLDRFKDLNDSYGHTIGDELIKAAGYRLKEYEKIGAIVGRLGGDEFGLLIKDITDKNKLITFADELISVLSEDYKLSNLALVHIGASAGLAIYPDHGNASEELIKNADAALYMAKNEGRATVRAYTNTLTELAIGRLTLENELRHAILNNELVLYYQPQVHIKTDTIVGVEALIRWKKQARIISPIEFIPIAEDTGLIVAIGEFVINEACTQAKIWYDLGYKFNMAINISTAQLRSFKFFDSVISALKTSGLQHSRLELEITESSLMQREEDVIVLLHSLKAVGVKLALDDFGTGYSSLAYLKRLPIDVLKIDKRFVDELPFSKEDVAISKAIIAMAKALNLTVLAEGVEREDQLEFLRECGCDIYQGYFKSKPIPADEFAAKFLTKEKYSPN